MKFITAITPVNILEERERFMSSPEYHPIFRYAWQENRPRANSNSVKSKLINAVIEQDLAEITRYARDYFDMHDWEYLEQAKLATTQLPQETKHESSKDFVDGFMQAFSKLRLDDYRVEVVDAAGFNFRPMQWDKKVVMSKHSDFQFFDVEGEIRHELVHVIRHENSVYNGIIKSPYYLPTEEGLATLLQDTSVNGAAAQFQHAAEYVASMIGSTGSLRDVYDYFKSIGFNSELAWQRAARHKFGFVDTSQPGDILKPAMYYAHSQKVAELTPDEQLRLFVGKIAVNELPKYPVYTGVIDIQKIKTFYNFA